MSFYCKYYDCPLENVTEQQQEQCWKHGEDCEQCMIRENERDDCAIYETGSSPRRG